MSDIACADQHFGADDAAKSAGRATIITKFGASEEWLDLETEGLTAPMQQKIADTATARCPGGVLPDGLLDPSAAPPAVPPKDDGGEAAKDEAGGDDAGGDEAKDEAPQDEPPQDEPPQGDAPDANE